MIVSVGRAELYSQSRQRTVTTGDVIYVHTLTPAVVAPPPLDPVAEEPVEEAAPPPPAEKAWLYTEAPEGHAIEFGTGRPVPLRSNGLTPIRR